MSGSGKKITDIDTNTTTLDDINKSLNKLLLGIDNSGNEITFNYNIKAFNNLDVLNAYNRVYELKVNKKTEYTDINDITNYSKKFITPLPSDSKFDKIKIYINALNEQIKDSNVVAPKLELYGGKEKIEYMMNYIHDFHSDKVHEIFNSKKTSFEKFCLLLRYTFDFHTWYDTTSKIKFYSPKTDKSTILDGINVSPDNSDIVNTLYGGSTSMENFYNNVANTALKVLNGDDLDDDDKKCMIIKMYCMGKNINYWLAKRYLYLCVGNEEINSDISLSTVIDRDNDKIIPKEDYNQLRQLLINNYDIQEALLLVYQYDMLNGITNTISNQEFDEVRKAYSISLYNDPKILKHQQLMKLIFNKFKGTFLRNDLETKYEVNKTNMEYSAPKPITKFVKSMSDDKTSINISDRSKYNNFFAKNTILQTALRTPRAFSGGKMFCGGAENLFNGANLYRSIYNNIKQKFQTLNVIMNEEDKKKIDSLIDRTAELETKLYNILANLNKFITSDLAEDKKHVEVNYDMIAAAVEQYEKTVKSYNKKNYVLFKDLMILLNYSRKITEHMTI